MRQCTCRTQVSAARANSLRVALLCSLVVLLLAGCGQQVGRQQVSRASSGPVQTQTTRPQLTYVAIGASDTFGIGTDEPYTENWAADLAARIGPGVHLINLGIPGILTQKALSVEVPVALDSHPDLITIWLGVNDIAEHVPVARYAPDLDLLLSRLQAGAPRARIAIAGLPDLTLLPYFHSFDQQALQRQTLAYNAAIAAIAQRHGAILIDLYPYGDELKSHPEYIADDGLHLTTRGYARLAEQFYQALYTAQGTMKKV